MKLTATFCKTVRNDGKTAKRYSDGPGAHGLMLNVRPPAPGGKPEGAKSWVQRIVIHGTQRTFGIGEYPLISLARARQIAIDNRRIAREGGDPIAERDSSGIPTFAVAVAKVIDIQADGWKDEGKSRKQWQSSLEKYAFPKLKTKRVNVITAGDIYGVVEPIWKTKRETASRVLQRIGVVMQWAQTLEYRKDNPTAAVRKTLPKGTGKAKAHHKALPYDAVGDAVRAVQASDAWLATKLAFECLVLTGCRSGEVRGARWDEIDMDGATWTIPASRMKAKQEHRIPLPRRCIDILEQARGLMPESTGDLVFPSVTGRQLSDSTLSKLMRGLQIDGVPHGFRSSFRDWAAERTNTEHAVMEAALAHTIKDRAEAAYARSDLFEKRRALMDKWAAYVAGDKADVVSIGKVA